MISTIGGLIVIISFTMHILYYLTIHQWFPSE